MLGATGRDPRKSSRRRLSRADRSLAKKLVASLELQRAPRSEWRDTIARVSGDPKLGRIEPLRLTEAQVESVRAEVLDELLALDREALPLLKQKQVQRLHGHISKAEKAQSWNAVASLERLLAQVQGTLEPLQVNVHVDAQVRDAVAGVLGSMSAAQLDALLTTGELVPDDAAPAALPAASPVSAAAAE